MNRSLLARVLIGLALAGAMTSGVALAQPAGPAPMDADGGAAVAPQDGGAPVATGDGEAPVSVLVPAPVAADDGGAPVAPGKPPAPPPEVAGSTTSKFADPPLASVPNPLVGLYRDRWQFTPTIFAQLDVSGTFGRGVSSYQRADGSGLFPGFTVPRVMPGFRGAILDKWYYFFLADFGANNGSGPSQSFAFRGGNTEAWLAYNFVDAFAIRLGQMSTPVTLENLRVPLGWDMMEGSRTAFLAVPNVSKDVGLMMHGYPGNFVYAAGIFNGEGNRRGPLDYRADLIGRLAYRINPKGPKRAQIGVSGRLGSVDPKSSWWDTPTQGLSTERGYNFWPNSYAQNLGGPVPTQIGIFPSDAQRSIGADAIIEFDRFDIQAEGQYFSYGKREVLRAAPDANQTVRSGEFSGVSYYVTANLWLTEPSRVLKFIRWESIALKYLREIPSDPIKPTLQLVARWEQLLLNYDSISRSPGIDRGLLDTHTTKLVVNSAHLGFATWFSRAIKLGVQWSVYHFPGEPVNDRFLNNQALAPGAVIQGDRGTRPRTEIPADVGVLDATYYRPYAFDARFLHEITARAQIAFP